MRGLFVSLDWNVAVKSGNSWDKILLRIPCGCYQVKAMACAFEV